MPVSKKNPSESGNKCLWYAELYLGKGLSIIPLKPRSKEPLIPWKEYQERLPTAKEIEKWFSENEANVAIVCGSISGNLIVVDFDSEEKFKEFYSKIDVEEPWLRDKLLNTWIVETGKGRHVYFRISCGREEFEKLFRTRVRFAEGVDVKAEGGYVVAPPSIHPSGKEYRFIQGPANGFEIETLTLEEVTKLLKLLSGEEEKREEKREAARAAEFRVLSDKELIEIKELIKDAWVEGHRQFLALFLSGWFAKAKVHPVSVAKLFRLIAEEKNDNELEERLSTIYYSYKKAWVNVGELEELDKLIEDWRNEGVVRRNVSKALAKDLEERVKGKSGVQEILEQVLGEEKALDVIRELEEILKTASPYRDSVIEILDYEKQLYAVANLRKLVVVRAKRNSDSLVYKERIFIGAPTKIVYYVNPFGGVGRYEIVWEAATRPRPFYIGPAEIEDILDRLKAEGLVVNHRLAKDVLNAIAEGFVRKGKAEVREEIESPGFYWYRDRVIAVKVDLGDATVNELREALELLNELAEIWFKHAIDRFATGIKWGVVAPFSFIYKQRGRWIPWIYLYGASYTGKSTLGEIVLKIWNLGADHRKTGANIDTAARIGYVLSRSTFPIVVNEPGNALSKEDIVEIVKNAIESIVVRGKYHRGSYIEIPSLAQIVFTSNRYLPKDDALLRRFIVLRFTFGDRIDSEKAREFEEKVVPTLSKLGAIGRWVARYVVEHPQIVEEDWAIAAEKILREMYSAAGLAIPAWIDLKYRSEENIYEDIKESIRAFILKRINEEYTRFVGRVFIEAESGAKVLGRTEVDFEIRVLTVIQNRLLPWAMYKDGEVYITSEIVNELKPIVGDIGGLKSIAELLGWNYKTLRSGNSFKKAMVVQFKEFVAFLKGEIEDSEHTEQQSTE